METMYFPGQTAEGIEDAETFFVLCHRVLQLCSLLRQLVVHLGSKSGLLEHINCEVVTRIVAQSLPLPCGVVVIDGYFGRVNITESTWVNYEHSWLMAPSAPLWVIDVVPFNGFMSPCIVQASTYPWRGLYRPADRERGLSPVRQKLVEDVVRMLKAVEEHTNTTNPDA